MSVTQGFASIGVDVKIGESSLNFVTNISDIGGTPASLDATCMKDTMEHSRHGVKQGSNFEVDFLFDNADAKSDYRILSAMEGQGDKAVEVTMPDGTKFVSKGAVSVRVTGFGVNALIGAKASIALSQDWVKTDPAASAN